ncbi:hypothetical protein [Spirosoma sp.]|uniref:hypothetical protein n=1 Tax=Spirosoma sp. TaxID=1899569 RepID=UPI003B3BCBCF
MADYFQKQFNWVLFITYGIAISFLVWHHEMWRDELQAWGIAASSSTLTELFQNTRYEGHPMLWFLMLWPLAKITNNPVAVQVLHTGLVLITAYLIIFRSPFSILEKVLILFSYFFLYEYGAIARNYQVGTLLICLICVLWKDRRKNLVKISILIFLLMQANAFACLIGLGLSVGLLFEELSHKPCWPLTTRQIGSALVILTGLYLTSLSVPPPDSSIITVWVDKFDIGTVWFALAGIAHGFLPLTGLDEYYFWNYSYVPFGLAIKIPLGLLLLAVAFFSMPKDKGAFVVLVACITFIFVFTYLKPRGNFRHFGHYTIALIAAFWIQGNRTRLTGRNIISVGYFGILVLLIQLIAGINAYYRDTRYPFSNSRNVADYIKNNYSADVAVAGVFQDVLTGVRWYLQKPVYGLETQKYGSYVLFSHKSWNDSLNAQPDSVTYSRYLDFQKKHAPALLIMGYHFLPVPDIGHTDTLHTPEGNYLFTCTKKFEGAITREDYYLFNVTQLPK